MKHVITLIRNGITQSGKDGRHLGRIDEILLDEGVEKIRASVNDRIYPTVQLVYSSGLIRCRQTAGLIYPNIPTIVLRSLEAMDLGVCEGKLYHEIVRDKHFTKWAREDTLLPFEGGEEPHAFYVRCEMAFRDILYEMSRKQIGSAAIITHRMVIETVLKRFCVPRLVYKEWELDYGGGYTIEFDPSTNTTLILNKF